MSVFQTEFIATKFPFKSFQIVSKSAPQLDLGKVPGWGFESKVTFLVFETITDAFFLKHLSFANNFLELWWPARGMAFQCGYLPADDIRSLFQLSFIFVFNLLP